MKLLFLYSTREGQTVKILKHIAQSFDHDTVEFVDIHQCNEMDFTLYDKVLIGASIRYGKLNRLFYRFVERYHKELTSLNAAFFCVNLTARKEAEGKDTPEGSVYVQTFLKKSVWQPKFIGVFAGAVRYPRYRFIDKMMIKLIMTITKGETDTSKEVEYTNWDKVDKFTEKFKQQ
ncbi:menaquinone-dependent protoporphyrinogen IX dehydrogenase [Vibrio sp. WJH972]